MNNLDKQYTDLLQDILDNGVTKKDRTGTGTLSVFGRQIRHKMSDGFPLLTTKKMPFKTITTELLWFLRGDSDIRFLWKNNCTIWDGDWYKKYKTTCSEPYTLEEVKQMVKDGNHNFHNSMFELGPVYGKQWRSWNTLKWEVTDKIDPSHPDRPMLKWNLEGIDQIQNLIHDLKTNPDSRRLMVSAWNVGELDQMTLPPCHYGFQVYTRELKYHERRAYRAKLVREDKIPFEGEPIGNDFEDLNKHNIPTRAISLMWNQRSVDTFLGLPFNIASYGLLLEIIAKSVNMVPDELIGNLGDTHLYLNHIEQAKEQIGRELSLEERNEIHKNLAEHMRYHIDKIDLLKKIDYSGGLITHEILDELDVPKRKRQPFPLPTLNINTEFWPYEGEECGEGPLDAIAIFKGFTDEHFCKCLLEEDIQLGNYQSHPHIKAPLSN